MNFITLDNQIIKETDNFYSVISKINNFLKIEPVFFENEPKFIKSVPIFRYKKNAILYSKLYNCALDNGFSLDNAKNYAKEKLKTHLKVKKQICYKSNEVCSYNCSGLCKESC